MITRTEAGYASKAYADAQAHLGEPTRLPSSGAWVLRRPAPEHRTDLVAPYPLMRCRDWRAVGTDLAACSESLSIVGVTDPFSDPGGATLQDTFPDLVRPWKPHHVVDLSNSASSPSSHHRRNIRRATATATLIDPPSTAAVALVRCYDALVARHEIRGPAAFPAASLVAQLDVPGARAWVAHESGTPVGVVVAYVDGELAWYHLGAATVAGYRAGAMYALFAAMLGDLADQGVAALDLGAGAGAGEASAGLERFKRGWADHTRQTHLVGRILNRAGYHAACRATDTAESTWFPAYRGGPA